MSGFRVTWDSSRPKGQRVVSIRLALEQKDGDDDEPSDQELAALDGAPVERQRGGKMYKVVTRQYMAEGHDGYDALKGCKYLIDDENGKLMSSLVRQYLLGEWKLETILLSPAGLDSEMKSRLSIYQQVQVPGKHCEFCVLGRENERDYQ